MKIYKTLRKRGLALFLALTMCLSLIQTTAFANEEAEHVHNEGGWTCAYTDPVTEPACVHEHDAACGYVEAVEEIPCACTGTDGEGNVVHEDGCAYAPAVEGAPCGHVCGGECTAVVTEGYWECTPPAGEPEDTEPTEDAEAPAGDAEVPEEDAEAPAGDTEVPAEVQAFLDAVAELPTAENVTTENAWETSEQIKALFDLYEGLIDLGLDEREDVAEALEVVYAVYDAVLAAEEIEDSYTYEAIETGVITSAFSKWIPNTTRYNIVGNGWTRNEAETGYGKVVLLNEGDTAVDSSTPEFWGDHYTFVPVSYGANLTKVVSNSNPKVATAEVTWQGGELCVTFIKGAEVGVTTIKVGYHVDKAHVTSGIAQDSDVEAVNGYLVYTVGNSGDGNASSGSVAYSNSTYDYFVINMDTGAWTRGKSYGATNAANGNFKTGDPPYIGYFYSRSGYGTTYPQQILGADTTNTDESVARVVDMELRQGNNTD